MPKSNLTPPGTALDTAQGAIDTIVDALMLSTFPRLAVASEGHSPTLQVEVGGHRWWLTPPTARRLAAEVSKAARMLDRSDLRDAARRLQLAAGCASAALAREPG